MSDQVDDHWLRVLRRTPNLKAAPVSSFNHVALAYKFDENVREGILVEVAHRTSGNARNAGNAYWIASVIEKKGYYVKLRWIGGSDPRQDFWRNLAVLRDPLPNQLDRRIHHVGFSRRHDMPFQPPEILQIAPNDRANVLREHLTTRDSLPASYRQILAAENESAFRPGDMVEATYTRKSSAMKPAVVVGNTGGRIQFKYVDEDGKEEYAWFHQFSEMFKPCGWSRVHGRPLISSKEYWNESATMLTGFGEPPSDDALSIFVFSPRLLPNFLEEPLRNTPFIVGDEFLVIDPLSPGIRRGIVSKVLANYYLMVKIVSNSAQDDDDPICLHSGSDLILAPDFATRWEVEDYVRPRLYSSENARELPSEIFKRDLPDHGFESGQFVEAAGVCGDKDIYPARVKEVVGHLLLIGFEGYDSTSDQFVPISSPDIYPIGWCNANEHPLDLRGV